tara:strand:+ start:1526 stop:1744 length:219 start_codon:yes stop_codon:yes gene_type:complete
MAAKGKASKSATGASMSKYDVEVEARLQALETAVASLQSAAPAAPAVATGDDHDKLVEVEAALNKVRGVLGV